MRSLFALTSGTMKLAVLGATGVPGIELVRMALEQQHEVCVLVRMPSKLGALAHNNAADGRARRRHERLGRAANGS